MAEQTRDETQRARADARERRRATTSKPSDKGASERSDRNGDGGPVDAAKHAARAAAAAALAGGLAGAAKALVERRRRADDDDGKGGKQVEERVDRRADPESSDDSSNEASDEALSRDPGTDDDGRDEQEGQEGQEELKHEPEQPLRAESSAERRPRSDDETPERGGSSSEVAGIVEQARRHVADLLGRDAESVSGVSRGSGSWTVTLEVVDLHRIPESTDVLSAYGVVLDDDGGLLSLERRGRYLRSHAEEGR